MTSLVTLAVADTILAVIVGALVLAALAVLIRARSRGA